VRNSDDRGEQGASGERLADHAVRSEHSDTMSRKYRDRGRASGGSDDGSVRGGSGNPNLSIDADLAQKESSYTSSKQQLPLEELSPLEAPGWGSLAEYIEGDSKTSSDGSGLDCKDNDILGQQSQHEQASVEAASSDGVCERKGSDESGGGRWDGAQVQEPDTFDAGRQEVALGDDEEGRGRGAAVQFEDGCSSRKEGRDSAAGVETATQGAGDAREEQRSTVNESGQR
ncbi:unnamed protein product, partial [Sphacelaria rigidula]